METLQLNRRRAHLLFAAAAFSIYAVIFLLARNVHAPVVQGAATLDLTITVSVAFYFFLVKRGHAGWLSLVTMALAGLRASAYLFPTTSLPVKWLAASIEILLIVNVVLRFRHVPEGDALTRIRTSVSSLIPNRQLARIVAAEIAVFYYAFFSYRSRSEPGFSGAKSNGYSFFGTLLILGLVFEGIPLHLLLMKYNSTLAWTVTGLDVYGLIWAVALVRANRLRTSQMDINSLSFRAGLIWEVDILWENVASIRPFILTDKPDLKAVFLNTPKLLIELKERARVTGVYGSQRSVKTLAISVDDQDSFLSLARRHFGTTLQPPVIGLID